MMYTQKWENKNFLIVIFVTNSHVWQRPKKKYIYIYKEGVTNDLYKKKQPCK